MSTNLTIDGNVLLFLAANVINMKNNNADVKDIAKWSDDKESYILNKEPGEQYNQFITTYLNSMIYPLRKNLNRVILVFDRGRSWRKLYLAEYFKDNPERQFEYKAGRKSEHNDKMFLYFNYFRDTIKYNLKDLPGVSILEGSNVEADDFFKYIVDKHNTEKNIIWSVDTDLQQLLKYDHEESWNIMLTPKGQTKNKKIYAPKEFIDNVIESKSSIFSFAIDNENSIKGIMKNLITNKDYKHYDIDPYKTLVNKIISGDKSDSIPNVFDGIISLEDKEDFTKLTTKLIKKYNTTFFEILSNNINDVVDSIIEYVNNIYSEDISDRFELIKNNLILNEKLIRLHLDNMPDYISEKIINKYNEFFNNTKFDYIAFNNFIKTNKSGLPF